jgi:hypothetical protein
MLLSEMATGETSTLSMRALEAMARSATMGKVTERPGID